MYSYWVQTGRDFIDFTGKRKPELKKLTHFKTIKDVEKHFKKEGGAYYIYYGNVKPIDIWGTYKFVDGSLVRVSNAYENKESNL